MAEYINPRAQACQNCVKAKAKCYGHTDGKCERCNRLGRDCVSQAPVIRKRKAGKTQRAQADRIAELEAKLDSLVSVLGTSNSPSPNGESPIVIQSTSSRTPPDDVSASQPPDGDLRFQPLAVIRPPMSTVTIPTDSDELLDVFRRNLAQQVPFISVPAEVTAETLSGERPFLYRAIIASSSYYDSVRQTELSQEFVRQLTDSLLFRERGNLDMLQGLLVFITWYNALCHTRSQLTALVGIAFSLVVDLHLYMPLTTLENHERFLDEMKDIISSNQLTYTRRAPPTKDEKRVILACFYLFSCVSSAICRVNPLHWTPYIQHCYDDISTAPESENDIYLAHLAGIQRISEDVKHSGIRGFPSQPRIWTPAVAVHFKLLMSNLQKFRAALPETLQQDAILLMHYHSVEMYLCEICFSMPPTAITPTPTLQRADILLRCLNSIRSLTSIFFSIDSKKPYINFSPAVKDQMYFAMMTLSKLSLFRADDWDMSNMQATLDLCTLLDRVVEMMERASEKYDLREDDKPWLKISRRMRQVRVRFDRLLASENRAVFGGQEGDGEAGAIPRFSDFDMLYDEFWHNTLPDDGRFI
ncbi:uncharacterized protein PAC_12662 [Phialocephala subalpina]|uniref:Zn(2)-C6 fungal-type domain-containing protein n=1 Tax=Phialocephala subalpina TaxID=576137 RepID=A0A1L7XCM0_9HELO|nr:uncharacterized protein PAC_12662 [Phialocephala subalpina]